MALNLLWGESHNVLAVTDKDLATKLKLKPGIFYVYYTPSYLNGFEHMADKELNMSHLQAYEALAWDEFKLNESYIQSEEFLKDLSESNFGYFNEELINKHFDKAFDWTYNVEFIMNPCFRNWYKDSSVKHT